MGSERDNKFIKYLKTDAFGNEIFIERSTGRQLVFMGTVGSRKDGEEFMLDNAVEAEMKRRHPDTYQDPDAKAGTA